MNAPNYNKLSFGRTLSELGKYGDKNNHGDCFNYGSVGGCDENCPVFCEGKCEIQEENQERFNKLRKDGER